MTEDDWKPTGTIIVAGEPMEVMDMIVVKTTVHTGNITEVAPGEWKTLNERIETLDDFNARMIREGHRKPKPVQIDLEDYLGMGETTT